MKLWHVELMIPSKIQKSAAAAAEFWIWVFKKWIIEVMVASKIRKIEFGIFKLGIKEVMVASKEVMVVNKN